MAKNLADTMHAEQAVEDLGITQEQIRRVSKAVFDRQAKINRIRGDKSHDAMTGKVLTQTQDWELWKRMVEPELRRALIDALTPNPLEG